MTWIEQNITALTTNAVTVSLHDANGALLLSQTSNFIKDRCDCVQNESALTFMPITEITSMYVKAFVGTTEYASYKLIPAQKIAPSCVYKIGIGEFKICYGCE